MLLPGFVLFVLVGQVEVLLVAQLPSVGEPFCEMVCWFAGCLGLANSCDYFPCCHVDIYCAQNHWTMARNYATCDPLCFLWSYHSYEYLLKQFYSSCCLLLPASDLCSLVSLVTRTKPRMNKA